MTFKSATPPTFSLQSSNRGGVFGNTPAALTVTVPEESLDKYKLALFNQLPPGSTIVGDKTSDSDGGSSDYQNFDVSRTPSF